MPFEKVELSTVLGRGTAPRLALHLVLSAKALRYPSVRMSSRSVEGHVPDDLQTCEFELATNLFPAQPTDSNHWP
jgi:hypothetical protein